MRPAGGHDPDMMNYAQSIDVFDIYAQMVTGNNADIPESAEHYVCAYAARKDGCRYTHTPEEITARYGSAIVMQEEMPPIDWPSMGRYVYMAKFKEKEEMEEYFRFVLATGEIPHHTKYRENRKDLLSGSYKIRRQVFSFGIIFFFRYVLIR